jgi:hypothetical protein
MVISGIPMDPFITLVNDQEETAFTKTQDGKTGDEQYWASCGGPIRREIHVFVVDWCGIETFE